ncbi:hypothetical protein P153DRAFT_305681 [Dothidotthia symphoricarpi CBS 119687]|uniref:Uncharacterized protein n=1 Tax=Dothidotthia symphoricarpi CBS 119687 TaxID=1392245 RepID=A0A6A6AT58_9PLEO|nr:uncharacterized protein P153DRAFT_305681 [Dothidotthia symphoricarpi CBS 119687]KAF2134850.1 hypothetical protein P153DRAFT_305681 [Dothidotthia symphoricarpi CBS 119687]
MSLPLLFTLPPGKRHELILVDTSKPTLKALNAQITSTLASSPNCAEFMGKYKSAETKEQIEEIKVLWDMSSRDANIWPESTILNEGNFAAVLEVLKGAPGKDVLSIKVGKVE